MADYAVGNYLVDRLQEIGLRHIFAIPGDYCADWIQDYVEPSAIQRIGSTNEMNAGYAADGYARVNGIGAACVTYSVGAISLLNPIAGAFVERVPVVAIVGAPSVAQRIQYDQTGMLWHHLIDGHNTNLDMYRSVTVAAERIENADLAPAQIDVALRACLTESRPVYLEMTKDIYAQACARPEGTLTAAKRVSNQTPGALQGAIDGAMALLEKAQRPLVWAGAEVQRFGLQDALETFVTDRGIPYASSIEGKSVLAETLPQYLGVFEGKSSPAYVLDAWNSADFILALGVWLTDENIFGDAIDWSKTTFAARDSVRTQDAYTPQITLSDFLTGVSSAAQAAGLGPYVIPTEPAPSPVALDPAAPITYQGFFDRIASFVDDSMRVCGGTGFDWFGSSPLHIGFRGGFIAQAAYGDIGYVVPAGLGAALADPRHRVVIFAGDGGFQMTAQSISNMARLGLNPIIFVMDNGVYGIEQWLAGPDVYSPGSTKPFFPLTELNKWDYAGLMNVFGHGGKGWVVSTYGDLDEVLGEALANTAGPSLVQVEVDSRSAPALAEWKVPASG